ncbi:MAG TPA: ankyrin repeat domain-containing protein [Candidatus Babeliales bacterium]|nr:ankyrin repeat domain-containing protein [Candidatus Babeliales bacterium]
MKCNKIIITSLIIAVLCNAMPLFAMQSDQTKTTKFFKIIPGAGRIDQENHIRSWIKQGGDINATTEYGRSLLYLASQFNDPDFVNVLIEQGAPIDAIGVKGYAPLNIAVRHGNTSVVELLLKNNANIDAIDQSGKTPLITALDRIKGDSPGQYQSIALLLLNHGANIEAKSADGITPLQWVIINKNDSDTLHEEYNALNVAKLLLRRGAKIDASTAEIIFRKAIFTLDDHWIKLLKPEMLKNVINKTNKRGETVLIEKIIEGNERRVEFLLKQGIDPYITDKAGFTAFDYAQQHPKIFALLAKKFPQETAQRKPHLSRRAFLLQNAPIPTLIHYEKFRNEIEPAYGTKQSPVIEDPVVQECIKKELFAYQHDKYVFYHAEPGKYRIYQFFIQELYTLMRSFEKNSYPFIFNRLFNDASPHQTINEYAEKNSSTSFGSTIENVLLSANIPLFGNVRNDASCTWYYFIKNIGIAKVNLPEMFERIFDMYDFNKKLINDLLELQEGSMDSVASLQQIIIPKDIVDSVAMLADSGACVPWPEMIDPSCWDASKGRHTCIASIIDKYRTEQIDINDALQARLLMNAAYGLNPESGIEFHLYTRLPEERIALLKKQVKEIADQIFSEWLVRQIQNQNAPAGMKSEELRHALKTFGHGDKQRQEAFFNAAKAARTPEQESKALKAHTPHGEIKEGQEESKEAADPTTREKGRIIAQQAGRLAQEKAKEDIKRFPSMERAELAKKKKSKQEQRHAEEAAWQKYQPEEDRQTTEQEKKVQAEETAQREPDAANQQENAARENAWEEDLAWNAALTGF